MRIIPNLISLSRVFLSLYLLWTEPLSFEFYTIYIICVLTDVFDGLIARKMGVASLFGAKLDSFADLIMYIVLLGIIFSFIGIQYWVLIWVLIICILRLTSIIITFIKYKNFAMLHTYSNKLTAIAIFITILLLNSFNIDVLLFIVLFIATIAAFEELIIHLSSKKLEENKKSIFKG